MNARDLVDGLNMEGAKASSEVRVLFEDGALADIMMVEGEEGIIYLKVEEAS